MRDLKPRLGTQVGLSWACAWRRGLQILTPFQKNNIQVYSKWYPDVGKGLFSVFHSSKTLRQRTFDLPRQWVRKTYLGKRGILLGLCSLGYILKHSSSSFWSFLTFEILSLAQGNVSNRICRIVATLIRKVRVSLFLSLNQQVIKADWTSLLKDNSILPKI